MLVVGDLNSDPNDPAPAPGVPTPYAALVGSGFTDAWTMRPHAGEGSTCCQSGDLSNRFSDLDDERVDLILSLTPPARVPDIRILGDLVGNKTLPPGAGGLWPSDHGGLAAQLMFN